MKIDQSIAALKAEIERLQAENERLCNDFKPDEYLAERLALQAENAKLRKHAEAMAERIYILSNTSAYLNQFCIPPNERELAAYRADLPKEADK